jgi:hypothetical protein
VARSDIGVQGGAGGASLRSSRGSGLTDIESSEPAPRGLLRAAGAKVIAGGQLA